MNYQPLKTFLFLPEEKRQGLINYSYMEFAEHSFKGASLSKIIRHAGIAKGSFYQYFRDKKHLYLYLIESSLDEKFKKLEIQNSKSDDLFDFLRSIGQSKSLSNTKQGWFMLKASSDHSFSEVQELINYHTDVFFQDLIERNKARLNPNLKPGVIIFMLTTLFNQFGYYLLTLEKLSEKEAAYKSFIEIIEKGVRR